MVHHPVAALAMAMEGAADDDDADQPGREREAAYLAATIAEVRGQVAGEVCSALLDGPVSDALCDHALATGTDLIVMTTHGRGPIGRFLIGSVADRLLRYLHLPVLLVRPAPERPRPVALRRILVALDGSSFAEEALACAIALGGPFAASYTLLRVLEPASVPLDLSELYAVEAAVGGAETLPVDASFYLERLATQMRRRGAVVSTRVASGPSVAATILEEAAAVGADAIALASHGIGGVGRLVVGSVAEKVLRKSALPVLVARPPVEVH
jgi:nucleotide-binding universal stress UspA family protein